MNNTPCKFSVGMFFGTKLWDISWEGQHFWRGVYIKLCMPDKEKLSPIISKLTEQRI